MKNDCDQNLNNVLIFFLSAEEEQSAFRVVEEENDNSGDKDAVAKQEEGRTISAPLVLSQERLDMVYRRLQCLQEQVKRLQVRRNEQREYDSQMDTREMAKDEGHAGRHQGFQWR